MVLCWNEEDKDRRRGVPPGNWSLRSTRILRVVDGEPWIHSSCEGRAAEFPLVASPVIDVDRGGDSPARIAVPPTRMVFEGKAVFAGKAARKGGALQLGFDLRDETGRGISVYRKDRRIEVKWRLLGKDGKEIAAGSMNYG